MSYDAYLKKCQRGELTRSRPGKGKGSDALLSYHDLPEHLKALCIEKLGHYTKTVRRNDLEPYIVPDKNVIDFFARHRNPDGKTISEKKQVERATNCHILNAIKNLLKDKNYISKSKKMKTQIWEEISKAVNELDEEKWNHSLPTSSKNLKIRFLRYEKEGCASFIHKGEGNQRTAKIKGDIADFILATYCLPVKYSIPETLAKYNAVKQENQWADITEGAIKNYLDKPEIKRIWTLARHGKQAYDRKFKHTTSRDKQRWFPNVYWAIDGTKLDLVYYDPESSSKMSAIERINVVFDVYSEKIIGWSLSETENHTDHFKALKMAVQSAECRPYLFTYDQQSGHKSAKMQELYSILVAKDGGTHYHHRARSHSSPAEGLFNLFQEQVITKFWNTDGQGITVKTDDAKGNPEFLMKYKDHLPTRDQALKQWETAVRTWNAGKHSLKDKARNEVYNEEMPEKETLELQEIMRYMWIEEKKKPITYRAEGISVEVAKKVYKFEVYDHEGNIDIEFRRLHVGSKFIVRYDPDQMDGFIQLLQTNQYGETYFVAYAEPKRKIETVPKLMRPGEKEQWNKDHSIRDKEYERDKKEYEALCRRTGITPEALIAQQEFEVKMQGTLNKTINIKTDKKKSLITQI
ncbi:hypothetical protein KCF3NO3_00710 [Chryseobacterium sp. KCF3-3]